MTYLGSIAVSVAVLLNLDIPQIHHLQPLETTVAGHDQNSQEQAGQQIQTVPPPPPEDVPVDKTGAQPVPLPVKDQDSRLSPETRLELIRYVSGEFARVTTSLPAGKKEFRVRVGEPIDRKALLEALADDGAAVNPGDNVQITKLEFGGSDITVELNGGVRGRSWLERIQISGGAGMPVSTQSTVKDYGATAATVNPGAVVKFDFGRPLPEMTPEELKLYLSAVFDFSNQRSAAVTWAESLPPEIREAIAEKRATVGMDQEQVLAALGRPERKVRERQPDGQDVEDWIYGQPPGKTVFVRFAGDKVIQVTQYP
jgi:hypothetical protein